MIMEKPFVSIIIVNFNGQRFLNECLSTVLGTKYPNFEVIFVDNASMDRSLEFVNKVFAKNKCLKIIRNNKNLGFGPANNVGFKQAKGEYIVLLNNDTSVESNWLATLVDALENDETIGLASSMVLNMDGQTIQAAGIMKCDVWMRAGAGYWIGQGNIRFKETYPKVFEISSALGAAMIARRDLLSQIGLFDPKYFFYYDDDYLSFRTWLAGKRVVTVSDSNVRHFQGGTNEIDSNEFFEFYHGVIGSASLIFDIYYNLLDLTKGLFIFFWRTYVYELMLEFVEYRRIAGFWGSISGALWILKNFKYIWKNRLKYWSKAVIDERALRSKMIKLNIHSSLYLIPRLWRLYFKSETDKYLKNLLLLHQGELKRTESRTKN
jgi:GT2 family glycosyltransferase